MSKRSSWPWSALLFAWTLWIDFGRFHEDTNADTVIPVLVSVLKWTPFFWQQDRYGMVVPFLTSPIKHPLVNLVAQSGMTIWAGLACFFLLARYFFDARVAPTIALLAIVWVLIFSDPTFPFAWCSITMFYGPALALGLGAFLFVEGTPLRFRHAARWTFALAMMVIAHWINFSIGIVLLLLFGARGVADPAREGGDPALAGWQGFVVVRARALFNARLLLLALGICGGRLIMGAAPPEWRQAEGYQLLPWRDWPAAWRAALHQHDYGFGPWAAYALVGLLIALVVLWRSPRARGGYRPAAALCGIVAAIVYGLAVEATTHARGGGFPGRYLVPSAGILCVLGVGAGVASVWPLLTLRIQRALPAVFAVIVSVAMIARFGTPSWAKVHHAVDVSSGERTDDLVAARCTHIVGWYYHVWPSVFHSLIRFRDDGQARILWGVAHRSNSTIALAKQVPIEELTLCAGKGHLEDVQMFGGFFGLPKLEVASERATIVVLDGDRSALSAWLTK